MNATSLNNSPTGGRSGVMERPTAPERKCAMRTVSSQQFMIDREPPDDVTVGHHLQPDSSGRMHMTVRVDSSTVTFTGTVDELSALLDRLAFEVSAARAEVARREADSAVLA